MNPELFQGFLSIGGVKEDGEECTESIFGLCTEEMCIMQILGV